MVDFNRQFFEPVPIIDNVGVFGRVDRTFFDYCTGSLARYRAYDSGTADYVTWTAETLIPTSGQTTPNYTGTLSRVHVQVPSTGG